jgi:hypothetical protein
VYRKILLTIFSIAICIQSSAQFGGVGGFGGIGNNQNGQTQEAVNDSIPAAKLFSFKQYFNALSHRDTMKVSWMFFGSLVLPGTAQIYNKDYWKLPILYAGVGGMIYGGWQNNINYQKTGNDRYALNRDLFYMGAAFIYWGSLMDGVVSYKSKQNHDPGRAALFSALLPGLGQAYNGDYWKIPIFYGALATSGYLWGYNNKQYCRYRDLYNVVTSPNNTYEGTESESTIKYYRDYYRRFRDYSVLATFVLYVLQIIDADVFATMGDFEVTNDLTLGIKPGIIEPVNTPNINSYASTYNSSAVGVKLKLTFK